MKPRRPDRLLSLYTLEAFRREAGKFLSLVVGSRELRTVRQILFNRVTLHQFDTYHGEAEAPPGEIDIVRDCARAMRGLLKERSDTLSGFSVAQALWDIARGRPRPDLGPGFFAEMIHLVRGVEGRAPYRTPGDIEIGPKLSGRAAARTRSRQLDRLWERVEAAMARYPDGLSGEARARRAARRRRVLKARGGRPADWADWKWHVRHVIRDPELLAAAAPLDGEEFDRVRRARDGKVPFGVTPHYASLIDEDPKAGRDRAIRAQVLPTEEFVREMTAHHGERERAFDFMLERETSPVDLVTRRYPAIVILKPFNTCPQICVYCQRNWEIDEAMAPHALAPAEKIEAACGWIERHPAVREVLVTGGDPLVLSDAKLKELLGRLARIKRVDMIRIGSRTPVTVPMRITERLADLLGSFRRPGRREVCLVTHVEHPYEITPETVVAVDRLRRRGIGVYNQQVYTFYVSRRFETARLRMLLRRIGIDPYYTFMPKGKEETRSYRVPLARLLQEQEEEARLLPGLRRTDEAVYNVPGLGKNYLRAIQHRDLVSVLPDGSRVYDFHPWEKKIARRGSYVGTDVPILEYLSRLAWIGEDPAEYESIWYYF